MFVLSGTICKNIGPDKYGWDYLKAIEVGKIHMNMKAQLKSVKTQT